MQNFPTNNLFSMFDPYLEAGPRDRPDFGTWNEDFKNIFEQAVHTPPREQIQDNQNNRPADSKVRAPERIQDNSQSQNKQLTEEEFAAVRDVLEENGYPPEKIEKLEARYEKDGLTWNELKQELGMGDEFDTFKSLVRFNIHGSEYYNKTKRLSEKEFLSLKQHLLENGYSQDLISKLQDKFDQHGLSWEEVSKHLQSSKNDMSEMLSDKLSKDDFQALKKLLVEHGFDGEQIKALEERYSQGDLKWSDVLSMLELEGLSKNIKLSPGEKTDLLSVFSAMGFNSKESQELVNLLQQGRHAQVWEAISKRLDNMAPDQKLQLTENQAASLLKALGIEAGKMEKFSPFIGRELSGNDLSNLMNLLKKEAGAARENYLLARMLQAGEESAKANGVEALLRDIARLALKEEGQSSSDSNKKKELSFLKSRLENNAKFDEASGNGSHKPDEDSQGSGNRHNEQSLFDKLQESVRARDSVNDKSDNEKDDPWKDFISRIRTIDSSDARNAVMGDTGVRGSSDAVRSKAQAQHREFISRQILDQVQNGMLRKLKDGRTQLNLQLDPPNLGRVGLVLQVHNQEVRALIKPSSPEVAQMVSENLARLKATLEQQGLRVNKIEVQVQTQENNGQNWQGHEEHNKARERMREAIRIARMRGLDMTGKSDDEKISAAVLNMESRDGPGLDIFA
ncbi:flagellar hook-length control protein FliK [Desulfonatronovibrio magnus]|uniref:flagellar hook-length control protein FliK n=1 Tax=Desulfonatronovibrio magnus TaxID=698827 RepID=UPI0005EB6F3B|nr:flagellar hook-length control protein FliK [Desulfonatronovibrio magnus]